MTITSPGAAAADLVRVLAMYCGAPPIPCQINIRSLHLCAFLRRNKIRELFVPQRFNSAAFAYVLSGKLCRVGFKGHKTQCWFMSRPLTLMEESDLA